MLYRNKRTGVFGVTFMDARRMSAASIPEGCPEFGDWIGYKETEPPSINRWQRVQEVSPKLVEGEERQAWEVLDLPIPLDEKKAQVKREIDGIAAQKRNLAVKGISVAEMASWPIKRTEALAYQQSGNEADAPNLKREAEDRGIILSALVERVLANAQSMLVLETAIAGRAGALRDAVTAADEATLLALLPEIKAGWPEINQ